MRTILAIAALFMVAGVPLVGSASEHSIRYRIAPADEYFGRQKESILEIRNRLDDFDRRADRDMLRPGITHELNDLQNAILDWQHKYPRDPWLPRSMHRLMRDYQRAGSASLPEALTIVALMQSVYPNDEATADTVASLFGPNESAAALVADDPPSTNDPPSIDDPVSVTSVSVQGTVIDSDTGAPIIGAVVYVIADGDTFDPQVTPFSATADDGSFEITGLPARTLDIDVQPPRGSEYAPYHITVDGTGGDVDAGMIRLAFL